MKIGLLWFESDKKKTIEKRVLEAAEYYFKKHGVCSDYCQIPLGTLDSRMNGEIQVGEIRVVEHKGIPKEHLWIGLDHEVKENKDE